MRHLQSHLSDQQLIHQGKLEQLRGLRVGVDAVFWLRSIQALKDPFADALGGIPPGIFGFVDKELDAFRRYGITPLFVFQGMAPPPQHHMFFNRMDQQMEMAWTYLAKGQKSEAQKCFAVSTSRINGDFVYFIFHHLRHRNYECFQAPYFAGAQLAHFAEQNLLHAVFGPPGLLLYSIPKVVIHLDFGRQTFDWVDLQYILSQWQINKDQFIDACMLAGTEYCLTYPYLNLEHFQPAASGRFNFEAAVYIVKQAPLINWMQTFPTEDMRNDHVEGYCVCKVLIQNSPILHTKEQCIRPLSSPPSQGGPPVPNDFGTIMGEKLPNHLYLLMCQGLISHKLPQALAKGEWTDKSQPLVDTLEFRQLLNDLQDYRQKALGLIAKHMHQSFQKKSIVCKAFWEQHPTRGSVANDGKAQPNVRYIMPKKRKGLRWRFTLQELSAEMARQNVDKVDFRFCLNWHANEYNIDGPLYQSLKTFGSSTVSASADDKHCLSALVHFMLLEHLELISNDDGGMTVLGDVLKDTPRRFQEPCLVALEMMKFGILSGEPFEPPTPDRPFPAQVKYPHSPLDGRTKSLLLLSRIMSLVPMRLKNDMWNADVDFDLAAFHSLVRALKRALRQLTESSLCSILLRDLGKAKLLPPGFMCASPKKEDHLQTPALLPTFMLPRACMGIVARFFLAYSGEASGFHKDLTLRFPCCLQPAQDLKSAFLFWEELKRCVDKIAEPLGAADLKDDMDEAHQLLTRQRQKLNMV